MMSLSFSELIYPMCLQGYAFQCSIKPPLASTEDIIGINGWTMKAWHKRTYV
ncbi:hypothetical protein BDA96_02G447400 [Sorghum bicolor]|uniref:Uncharacterized protein n=2 Tax=Sorghum bicolor TaxID=4558 RepID=A0A921RUZ4_SORBI|nr:hypothetical protein BDA96_02G447400 [Sorghum bicolor]OQU90542.1 hypothetical protein SORBI_3002G427050 [Sorghum bicolor]